jgi:hypothetical protein
MSISSSPSRSIVSNVLTRTRWASSMFDGIAAWPSGSATTRLKSSYAGFGEARPLWLSLARPGQLGG